MVKRLFDRLNEISNDNETLLFVLIDEVESIATARDSATNGSDPSDAIRVVNALLTQIDQLRRKNNVVIMATSNLTECIDLAFLSRADIKQYIGPPGLKARYSIFYECAAELMSKGLILPQYDLLETNDIMKLSQILSQSENSFKVQLYQNSLKLFEAAQLAEGISGRTLRKLPFLSFVFNTNQNQPIPLSTYLQYLIDTIQREKKALHFKD